MHLGRIPVCVNYNQHLNGLWNTMFSTTSFLPPNHLVNEVLLFLYLFLYLWNSGLESLGNMAKVTGLNPELLTDHVPSPPHRASILTKQLEHIFFFSFLQKYFSHFDYYPYTFREKSVGIVHCKSQKWRPRRQEPQHRPRTWIFPPHSRCSPLPFGVTFLHLYMLRASV